jgi:hypothetical protein
VRTVVYVAHASRVLGSAGMLPAAVGILPTALTVRWVTGSRFLFSMLSGNMPDRAGNMPALPRDSRTHTGRFKLRFG